MLVSRPKRQLCGRWPSFCRSPIPWLLLTPSDPITLCASRLASLYFYLFFLFLFDPVLDLFLPLFWSWIDSAILVAKRCRVLWSLYLQFVVHYTTTQYLIRFLLHTPDYVHVENENGICSYQAWQLALFMLLFWPWNEGSCLPFFWTRDLAVVFLEVDWLPDLEFQGLVGCSGLWIFNPYCIRFLLLHSSFYPCRMWTQWMLTASLIADIIHVVSLAVKRRLLFAIFLDLCLSLSRRFLKLDRLPILDFECHIRWSGLWIAIRGPWTTTPSCKI